MPWGRKNLEDTEGDLFFAGAGETLTEQDANGNVVGIDDNVCFDLAMLSQCNHTIITRGTFSMWAALLAGGEYYTEYGTIVPPHLMYANTN